MSALHSVTRVSANRKTGAIVVTRSSAETCPPTCPLIDAGCYAKSGNSAFHWPREGKKGALPFSDFVQDLDSALRDTLGSVWRHNEAGDLPGNGEEIDSEKLETLRAVSVRRGVVGFTYTHKKSAEALDAVSANNARGGFVVNVSADSPAEAAQLKKSRPDLAVACVAPRDFPRADTVDGVRVVTCPQTYTPGLTCAKCQVCANGSRDTVIAFPLHGSQAKRAESKLFKLSEIVN